MATIYRKTAKGHDEISTRAHKLGPRLRTALIMVDGKRDDALLSGLIAQQADEVLASLLEQGFIEVLDTVAEAPRAASRAPSRAPGEAGAEQASPRRAAAAPAPSFENVRRDAVRTLTDLVGPLAEALALRMEKATSPDALRPLLDVATQVIRNTRGAQAAADYAARFGAMLR